MGRHQKQHPFGYTPDKVIYLWLKREAERSENEIDMQDWRNKCIELMEQLKLKHKTKEKQS